MKKLISVALLIPTLAFGQSFQGFDDPTLDPVLDAPGEWGQKWTPKIGQCYKVESGRIKRISEDGQTT